MGDSVTSPTGQRFPPTSAAAKIVAEMYRKKGTTPPPRAQLPLPQSPDSAAGNAARQLDFGTGSQQTEKIPRTQAGRGKVQEQEQEQSAIDSVIIRSGERLL